MLPFSFLALFASAQRLNFNEQSYCSVDGTIQDSCCEYKTADEIASQIAPLIDNLVKTKFFRYHKINLHKECKFWNSDMYCTRKDCAVETLEDTSIIPSQWEEKMGMVDFSSSHDVGSSLSPFKSCEFSSSDFCVVDDEKSTDGVYVDLLKNPERFTGYSGENANRICLAS